MKKTKGLSSGQLKPPTGKPMHGNKAKTDNPLSSGQIRYHTHAAAAKPSTQTDMIRKAATGATKKGTTHGSRPTFISSMLRRMDGISSPKGRSDGKICGQHKAVPGEKIRECKPLKVASTDHVLTPSRYSRKAPWKWRFWFSMQSARSER